MTQQPYLTMLDTLSEGPDLQTFLRETVRIAARDLSGGGSCGLAVCCDEHGWTTAASSDLALRADEAGYGGIESPGLEAMQAGSLVEVDDLAEESRWAAYRPYAMDLGVRSVLAAPLPAQGRSRAALTVYSQKPHAFASQQRQQFEMFAGACAAALGVVQRLAGLTEVEDQLRHALDSRGVIDQAIGIIMAQQRCPGDTAFAMLRAASQRRNRKLRDLAVDIVTRVGGQAPHQPTPFKVRAH
ncbi:GAF and ANTAR domain-containing protein [Actinoplanes sp. TFC3]|uniref:GAF and ANTAR domain-containing protein n=1 Tax=Actinoplanes sp. TFC3 TaxID=1710355 RepID=UPI0008357B80|nr:GAF and ANTAR domain-containing protein [Actinoplanes sp. TFC3]